MDKNGQDKSGREEKQEKHRGNKNRMGAGYKEDKTTGLRVA